MGEGEEEMREIPAMSAEDSEASQSGHTCLSWAHMN